MRILWLSHLIPYPPRSGVAQRSYGLLNEVCKKHDVTLLAFHQRALMKSMSHTPEQALDDAINHLGKICDRVEVFEIPSERSKFGRYLLALSSLVRKHPFTINWLKSGEFSRALIEARSNEFDLVHFDTISLARFRDHFEGVACVMNHHNIESHLLYRRARGGGSMISRAYDWQEAVRLERYERRTASRFDLHVTCSDLDRDRLLEIAPGVACSVIPNGVDVRYFEQQYSAEPAPIFSFVGTLGWGPNRDAAEAIATELWPAIAGEWPQARIYLVGSNPPPSARDLAARDDRFVVTGFADDVRPLMAQSSFFLCPIREGGGTKLKILNAMAMGKVVIADPIACEGIDVSPESDVILATTKQDYLDGVRGMLADPSRYARVARAARGLIEREYAYEVIGRDLDRHYSSLRESFGSER